MGGSSKKGDRCVRKMRLMGVISKRIPGVSVSHVLG